MITFRQTGNFGKTTNFLDKVKARNFRSLIESYAAEGVSALSNATPIDSGLTANSWKYEIKKNRSGFSIFWINDHIVDGVSIAILIQYGHGTKSGSFIQGKDYINPAIRPIFDKIVEKIWKEVESL